MILQEVNLSNNYFLYFSLNLEKIFFTADITPQLSDNYINYKKTIEDEMKQDLYNKRLLKMESETFVNDAESSKKIDSNDEQKLNKYENISVKNATNSSTSEESYSKKHSIRSTEDRNASEKRKKKKALDSKILKYYPNVPGETIKNH